LLLTLEQDRFAATAPRAEAGIEAASALAGLFGGLVLYLFPIGDTSRRVQWVAAAFVTLGLGDLLFAYAYPLLSGDLAPNSSVYAWLAVESAAGALLAIGLVPPKPKRFRRRSVAAAIAVMFGMAGIAMAAGPPGLLPPVVTAAGGHGPPMGGTSLHWLTGWHRTLPVLPLALALASVLGLVRHGPGGTLGRWLMMSMLLLVGVQLHNVFWPSAYSLGLNAVDLIRLALAVVVTVGAALELRCIARTGEEHSRRLGEIAALKADFTAMVAHELGSPIAAVRGFADLLATEDLGPEDRSWATRAIHGELDRLDVLIGDVRTVARAERDDFAVLPRPVPVEHLLGDATSFAASLPGDHPITTRIEVRGHVSADPQRIGQVLRNLLSNAAKYSAPGAAIELRAVPSAGRVRVEVADHGAGIHPDDRSRILEKFGRGRDEAARRTGGIGLGLYLSRRILEAHGAELAVASVLGTGSVFSFELERAA
jgi:signal transduction histidine kinase